MYKQVKVTFSMFNTPSGATLLFLVEVVLTLQHSNWDLAGVSGYLEI